MNSRCTAVNSQTLDTKGDRWKERVNVVPRNGQSSAVIKNTISDYQSSSKIATKRMTTENIVGVQTRAMTEAQCIEDGAHGELVNNLKRVQGTNPVTATGQGTQNPK